MVMLGTGLAVKDKEKFSAIPAFHLIGDPELDFPDALKISEAEIEDQRLNMR